VAAYVISLTRNWNRNWGGHLAFFNERGDVEAAFLPSFNALNVFAVPQLHAVQMIAPFARGVRTSLTGWVHV
jgi:Rps23 Pro-64 3,4-dihydroxylase Tpa1-like proline 4-hydroxylase